MARIAQQRKARWPGVDVTLVDRQRAIDPGVMRAIDRAGWSARSVTGDVFEWLAADSPAPADLVFANLFVHHFAADALTRMFALIAMRSRAFVCCEPRRSKPALAGSHLVGLLGAGAVARFDAVASVHAGFRERELSALWPATSDWTLGEYRAGLFSHCFVAVRKDRR